MIDDLAYLDGYFWPQDLVEKRHKSLRTRSCEIATMMCERRRLVVQAGGSFGVWPRYLSAHFDAVLTFEPEAISYECLSLNLKGYGNVIAINAALGEATRRTGIQRRSLSSHRVTDGDEVLMLALDDLNMERVDALLLDVEGYELNVLQGATQTIKRCHPIILLEDKEGRENFGKAAKMLEDMGYSQRRYVDKDRIMAVAT